MKQNTRHDFLGLYSSFDHGKNLPQDPNMNNSVRSNISLRMIFGYNVMVNSISY